MNAITNREDVIAVASNAALEILYSRYLPTRNDYLQAAMAAGDAVSLAAVYASDVAITSAEASIIAEEIAHNVTDALDLTYPTLRAFFVCISTDVYYQQYDTHTESRDAPEAETREERLTAVWDTEIQHQSPEDRSPYLAGGAAAAAGAGAGAGAADEVWDDGYPEEEEEQPTVFLAGGAAAAAAIAAIAATAPSEEEDEIPYQ
jgi:hypothetical protein